LAHTTAHPRTAILVNTLAQGLDDLWHFAILLGIIMWGFITLGTVQFAGDRFEYSTPIKSFETLWEMLLGEPPDSGPIPRCLAHVCDTQHV